MCLLPQNHLQSPQNHLQWPESWDITDFVSVTQHRQIYLPKMLFLSYYSLQKGWDGLSLAQDITEFQLLWKAPWRCDFTSIIVHFTCQVRGCFWMKSPESVNFDLADYSLSHGWASSNPWKAWPEQTYQPPQARGNLPANCLWTSSTSVFLLGLLWLVQTEDGLSVSITDKPIL